MRERRGPLRAAAATAVLAVLAAALALAACRPRGERFVDTRDIDTGGWAYIDAVAFVPQRVDSLAPVNLSLAVRHDASYPYSNLWLRVEYSDRGHARADTLNIELADLYGRWLGKGFGSSYQLEVPVARNIIPANGEPVVVRHIMRVDTLRGIDRLGLSLTADE